MGTTITSSNASSLMPSSHWDAPILKGHSVQFYEDDSFLLEGLSRFIGAAIGAGDFAIVIATQAHGDELRKRLIEGGLDLMVASKQGRFVRLDAAETLAQFMVDDQPDYGCFEQIVGGALAQLALAAKGKDRRVVAFGEMVSLLWQEGKREAALHLEQLWNRLAEKHSFQLHCAYPIKLFSQANDAAPLERICAEHSQVAPAEPYASLATDEERLHSIAMLQQKAQALETEMREREKIRAILEKRESERRYLAAIVESSDDAIASKDLNGIVTSWNRSAEEMFGYKSEEIVGRPITTIIPPELHRDEAMILGKIRRGEKIEHFETVRVRKNGQRIEVSLTISPVKDDSGNVIGAAKIVRDITEKKKIERALRTTEKLAAAGRLAATVAHEINNPLEAITNLVYLATRDLPDASRVESHLALASRELDRVAHIARQTLGFYRDTSAPIRFRVAQILDDLLALYEKRFEARNIRVVKQYDNDLEITALAGEIRQAFSNLISNAIDAMPRGGSLVIRACKAHEWNNTGFPGVRISILDTGSGISPQHKSNLFQPFFTTKTDIGTGLGLWITRNIVEKHHGMIHMKSRTGPKRHGTVFSVFLPFNEKAAA